MKYWIAAALALVAAMPARAEKLTYVDLVKRLTDLQRLATLPAPGEKEMQWSSYDRRSKYDEATGKYVDWDANGDGHGIIREETGQQVLAEMQGPGCIWRIWSANPKQGHVRIYLDGATTPAVDLPFDQYFDHSQTPFTYPALVHDASSGKNCYVPIPFEKSCKITADPDWGDYYHFGYTLYPKDTEVPTFSRDLSQADLDALAAADKALSDGLGSDPAGKRPGEDTIEGDLTVPAGGTAEVPDLDGPAAIIAIRVKLSFKDRADQVAALRELAIRITWDDDTQPAVWAPLGDFFGTAPGENLYKSLPCGMTPDGYYSFWYMPFAKRAHVELVNDGKVDRDVSGSITYAPLTVPIERLARFHAKWHRDAFLPTDPDRAIDWTMLKTTGQGRFCGVVLHVWNPSGGWWGEGDEKFFVDGEKFPSTFGTGSEDFFGYAWGNPALFQNAYHDQTYNNANNRGNICVNRWFIPDNVPFQTSFEGCIEKYYPDTKDQYASTAFWYEAPGGGDQYTAVPVADRLGYFQLEPPPPMHVAGAQEGEDLKVLECSGGTTQIQDVDPDACSSGKHLWWTGAKPGDKLTLAFQADSAGSQDVIVGLTKARDYGIVQFYVDGQKIGDPIDLYSRGVVATGPITLGTLDLAQGDHKLTVEIAGANDQAVKSYMVGLDYVKLAAK